MCREPLLVTSNYQLYLLRTANQSQVTERSGAFGAAVQNAADMVLAKPKLRRNAKQTTETPIKSPDTYHLQVAMSCTADAIVKTPQLGLLHQ